MAVHPVLKRVAEARPLGMVGPMRNLAVLTLALALPPAGFAPILPQAGKQLRSRPMAVSSSFGAAAVSTLGRADAVSNCAR
jgi:hypothetical protein